MPGSDGTPDNAPDAAPDHLPANASEATSGRPPSTPGKRKAVPERVSRNSGGVPAPRQSSRPAARPASRPPAPVTFPVLPPAERPAARPARRKAEPPTLPPGYDPHTDPYGIPAIPSAHAPRHAAPRPGDRPGDQPGDRRRDTERFAPPPPPEAVAAAAVAPTPTVEPSPAPPETVAPAVPPAAVTEPEAEPVEKARTRGRQRTAPVRLRRREPRRSTAQPSARAQPVDAEAHVEATQTTPVEPPVDAVAAAEAPIAPTPPAKADPAPQPDARTDARTDTRTDTGPDTRTDTGPDTGSRARRVVPRAPAARPRTSGPEAPTAPARQVANPAATRVAAPRLIPTEAEPEPGTSPAGGREWWMGLVLLGAAAVVLALAAPGLPDVVRGIGGVLISSAYSWGLAARTGGRPYWALALAGVLGVAAIATEWQPLQAGAAVGTGVVAATFAVMLTTPAATYGLAIREALIATAVAWVGALGVFGFVGKHPGVDVSRFQYVVLGLALAGAFALVYRLGAGLHGLGRRGYVVAGGAVLMLVIALAYSEAIANYGSRDIISAGHDLRSSVRSHLGAVPHPIVGLLGYPALLWGVFMRARRRQGWWVTAFGVAATAPTATRLVAADHGVTSCALGTLYSFAVGIAIGYLVVRVEQSFTGTHGRRARRDEEAVAHRPEPRRRAPLH